MTAQDPPGKAGGPAWENRRRKENRQIQNQILDLSIEYGEKVFYSHSTGLN
jgi:hypothetical protein